MENRINKKAMVYIAIAGIICLVSFFGLSSYFGSEDTYTGSYATIEKDISNVEALTAGSAAMSTAISLIPGDAGTPIADKFADMSGYFVVILTALFVEKWLLTITGSLAFRIMIPIACLLFIAGIAFSKDRLSELAVKATLIAIIIWAVIPASVVLSDKINDSYDATMQQTIQQAQQNSDSIQKQTKGKTNENFLEKVFNKVKGGVTGVIKKFENTLSQYVEAIAVLIVTSCVIPVLVILFFIWMIKMITGIPVSFPRFRLSEKFHGAKSE